MVVFLLITTSSVPYLLLMVKFFILTGDFCFSIASRVSCLEVAKQTPLCTLDFVCRVQLMYDVWPDFLSGDTEWTYQCSSGVSMGKRVYFLLNELCETKGYIGPRVTI